MDGGGGVGGEEKGAEKLMDDYLKTLGLHRKRIAKDGSCLFRAVAEQVSGGSYSLPGAKKKKTRDT
ncbi:OTU domain-containing protein 4 [Liparis tanakae]|uniref:OTU domain-containing protein 4 n=1 Tax=Liparis tanakae TaxID=230148 RepID=A0A4Z2E365_9TELE|nr:OTU domain-containing protein 4 [Liparis tanakae]